jgi:pimeloyl-ACP methyl ester carboxylesterase
MQQKPLLNAGDKKIRLSDGRALGYAEYGASTGRSLFYFHGHPGSRFEAGFLAEAAAQSGIRLVGIDRPGMGLSSYKAGRRLLDWPDDVIELADALRLDRFSLVGFSGGGPYVLACVRKYPDRLAACGIVAGVGHTGRVLSFLSMWVPWVALPLMRGMFRNEEQAKNSLVRAARSWVEPDRKAISVPGVSDVMAASIVEALGQGSKGPAYDGVVLGRPWGFELEEVAVPSIYLWHGELDREVPLAMGRTVAEQIRNCKPQYYRGEGHISLIVNHAREIVKALSNGF